jgi:hypothetical protein
MNEDDTVEIVYEVTIRVGPDDPAPTEDDVAAALQGKVSANSEILVYRYWT